MQYLVISDIHANIIALDAVLADAKNQFDKVWCLGDIVGYGPYPNQCIDRLNEFDNSAIAGNHDWAVLDKLDVDEFNSNARFAVLWTREQLTEKNFDYLRNLPLYLLKEKDFTLVHGSPRHPIWEYILYPKIAQLNFKHFETAYCLVGHTHSPVIYIENQNGGTTCESIVPDTEAYRHQLDPHRLIMNPGSIGQPRDGDPRASYAILDTDKMTFEVKRVAYNVEKVQSDMRGYDFPAKLWNRLAFGY